LSSESCVHIIFIPSLLLTQVRFSTQTQTWPRPTLLGNSKAPGRAVLHILFGGQRAPPEYSGDTHSPALKIGHRDLPNRVTTSWLLGAFGEVGSVGTLRRKIEKTALSNNAVFPPLLWTGKRRKIAKRPYFTKCAQEPTYFTPVRMEADLMRIHHSAVWKTRHNRPFMARLAQTIPKRFRRTFSHPFSVLGTDSTNTLNTLFSS